MQVQSIHAPLSHHSDAAASSSVSKVFTTVMPEDERVAQHVMEQKTPLLDKHASSLPQQSSSASSFSSPSSSAPSTAGAGGGGVVHEVHTHTGVTTAAAACRAAATMTPVMRSDERVVFVRHCSSSRMPIELCYRCYGDPAQRRPVVLLVCGLNMQLTAWDETFCDDLVRAGFFVVCYDNRDSGYSTKIASTGSVVVPRLLLPRRWAALLGERLPYTLEDMAKDGLALLDVLHVPCAHVLGISMGGMIAQTMALLAPSRVLSLTSIMSTTNAPDLPDAQLWVKLWMVRSPPRHCTLEQLLAFREATLRRLLQRALPLDTAYFKERYLISLRRSAYAEGLLRHAAAVRRCGGRDEALRQLHLPALVVHGAQDVVVPPVHGYRTATVLRYARLLVIKNMGHYFHPAFFATIVRAFAGMAACTVGPGYDAACSGLRRRISSRNILSSTPELYALTAAVQRTSWPAAHALDHTTTAGDGSERGRAAAGGAALAPSSSTSSSAAFAVTTPSCDGLVDADEVDGDSHHHVNNDNDNDNDNNDDDDDEMGDADDVVPPEGAPIASMAPMLATVVISPASPVGQAVRSSVMAAVPRSCHPATPQAALLDLHDEDEFGDNNKAVTTTTTTTTAAAADADRLQPSSSLEVEQQQQQQQQQRPAVQLFVPGARSRWNDAPPLLHSAAEAAAKVFVCPTLVGVPVTSYKAVASARATAAAAAAMTQTMTTRVHGASAQEQPQQEQQEEQQEEEEQETCAAATAAAATGNGVPPMHVTATTKAAAAAATTTTTAYKDIDDDNDDDDDVNNNNNDDNDDGGVADFTAATNTTLTLPTLSAQRSANDNNNDDEMLASMVASTADVTATMLPPVITDAETIPLLAAATGVHGDDDVTDIKEDEDDGEEAAGTANTP